MSISPSESPRSASRSVSPTTPTTPLSPLSPVTAQPVLEDQFTIDNEQQEIVVEKKVDKKKDKKKKKDDDDDDDEKDEKEKEDVNSDEEELKGDSDPEEELDDDDDDDEDDTKEEAKKSSEKSKQKKKKVKKNDEDDEEEKESDEEEEEEEEEASVGPTIKPHHSLSNDLEMICNKNRFSDVQFLVGDKKTIFYAHKIMLASVSPVFAAMLYPPPTGLFDDDLSVSSTSSSSSSSLSSFSSLSTPSSSTATTTATTTSTTTTEKKEEKKSSLLSSSSTSSASSSTVVAFSSGSLQISLPECEPAVFEALLKFVYTGTATIPVNFLEAAMKTAQKYAVDPFLLHCFKTLEEGIDEENACTLYQNALSLTGDDSFGLSYIEKNTTAVLESKGFLDLSKEKVMSIVQSGRLRVREADLFLAVLRWCRNAVKQSGGKLDLNKTLAEFIPHIRFPLFSVSEFTQHVQGTNFLSQQQMLETYTYIACKDSKGTELPKVSFISKPRGPSSCSFVWQYVSNGLTVEDSGLRVTNNESEAVANVARGSLEMAPKSGVYYWEVAVRDANESSILAIGVCTASASLETPLGQHARASWAYRNTGVRLFNSLSKQYADRYGTGDVVGCRYDSDKGQLGFYLNKQSLGTCFFNITDTVFPACELNGQASFSLVEYAVQPD
eukprot:TRINITY_DN397_c0_g1_i1.p1 TRINITY_DN397_c0_g1~~TRINITY_DN397_c0_g1_i1.p1  ORF type:complete len:667 (-),score=253.19 TRINITY_DN397_c0_g1_i1:116-2116(-)